jgi:glycosyltransferase involved in cell wall biosynthesis
MLFAHRLAGTWRNKIGTYIALTSFSKEKFIAGGLPPEKIVVKPNFLLNDPGFGDGSGGFALFLGRLSEEKGLDILLKAWECLGTEVPLKILGEGPLARLLQDRLLKLRGVEWLGQCARERVMELLKSAAFLVLPSKSYEQLPMALVEASACGTPAITSDIATTEEVIIEGVNGMRFRAGDADDLVSKAKAMLAHPDQLRAMRRSARMFYERNYTAERNYNLLMKIYAGAIDRNRWT